VLDVAYAVFAAEGLSVPIDEIARRAGVGAGTVYRHFPTKEALFTAIVLDKIGQLVENARTLATADDRGAAFFEFFTVMVRTSIDHKGLADALAGEGFDIEAAAAQAEQDLRDAMCDLLVRAQQAGAVRDDVGYADIKALIVGCVAMERQLGDVEGAERTMAIVYEGLQRARPATAVTTPARQDGDRADPA
jgi:AcrR family transcriptional regulator